MPVELHIHAAGPLDYYIPPDRIVKWAHKHICVISSGGSDRRIHVGYQITRPLRSERIWGRCRET
jgi:hypothetical protein